MSCNNIVLHRPNRQKITSSNDSFYSLPDEILSHILSLMPTKYAVRTSILSKSWRYRWTLVTKIDLDYLDYNNRIVHDVYGFTSFVDRVLNLCETTQVKSFRLHISDISVSKSSVSNWINEAVRLNVCELDIRAMVIDLPLSMFTCKTLTKLTLVSDFHDNNHWEFPCQVNLPCLKNLDIALFIGSFVHAFDLIKGCPMLESLSWEVAWRLDEEDYIINFSNLKQLKLTLPEDRTSVINKVVLHVPNLEYLFVGGVLDSIFVMEDVSSLVEASVSVSFGELGYDDHHLRWVELLKGLSGVKSLSVKYPPSIFRLPCFPNMKHLKLGSSWNSGQIFQFLEGSPKLEHVDIEKLEESPWIQPKVVPACMLTSLTTIKFSVSTWCNCDTPFLEYMLGNAKVLKTVTITSEYSSNIEKENELCDKLVKFPKASRCCEFHLG